MDTARVALLAAATAAGCGGSGELAAVDGAMPDRVIGGDASEADAAPDGPTDAGIDAPMPVDAGRDAGTDAGRDADPIDSGTDAGAVYECDIVEQDCVEGEACRFRLGERGTVCTEDTGAKWQGDHCQSMGECSEGLQCMAAGVPLSCRRPCRVDSDCGVKWDGGELDCRPPPPGLMAPDSDGDEWFDINPDPFGICDN